MGDCVTDLDFHRTLDSGNDVAYVSASDFAGGDQFHPEKSHLFGIVFLPGTDEFDFLATVELSIKDFEIGYDSPEGVEYGVEDEGLEGRLRVALGGGDLLYYRIQERGDPFSCPGRNPVNIFGGTAEQVADLVGDHVRLGGIHVYLVEDWDYLQGMVDGLVQVGDRLGLHSLGGINHQQGAFARCYRAGHFI